MASSEAAAAPLPPLAAARWVPDRPRYVIASPAQRDGGRAVRDLVDLLAVITGRDAAEAIAAVSAVLGVDPRDGDPLAAAGVDPSGGWAVFSDDLNPTVVVHLAAPAQAAAWLARLHTGPVTRTTVDGVEVVSLGLPAGVTLRWAIERDWLWLHLALRGAPGAADDAGRWFAASHARHDASWTGGWAWVQRAAGTAASVVGILDLHGTIAGAVARLPEAVACAHLIEPIDRIGLALEGDERHVVARATFDLAPAGPGPGDRLRGLILPPPAGWDAVAARAAIAAQWNLDLGAVQAWLAPCLGALGAPGDLAEDTGIRAARALVVDLDPDALSGSGAVALDVTSTGFLERQLARIPMRRTFERARTFGPYRGFSIAIPFRAAIDYVLVPRLAIAATGDGLLDRLVAAPADRAPGAPPILAIDVAPPAMSAHAWAAVIDALAEQRLDGSPGPATRRAVAHLQAWRDAHLAVTADGGAIVLQVSGNRR